MVVANGDGAGVRCGTARVHGTNESVVRQSML